MIITMSMRIVVMPLVRFPIMMGIVIMMVMGILCRLLHFTDTDFLHHLLQTFSCQLAILGQISIVNGVPEVGVLRKGVVKI